MDGYDIAFVGHVSYDEIVPFEGQVRFATGGSAFFSAIAAAPAGKRIALITKMHEADRHLLDPVKKAGIDIFRIPAPQTTAMRVVHPTPNVDEREMIQPRSAGFIAVDEMPAIETHWMHFAGLTDQDFAFDLLEHARERGCGVSVDMQSFVRQVDPVTRRISFKDAPRKMDILSLVERLKVDMVEAQLLTGTDDPEEAGARFEEWGCAETVITRSEGVLVRHRGKSYFEGFSNRNTTGRTGRGDTVFGAYLSRRLDHDVAESLKFAAALTSIKMERPGPFMGTLEEVTARIKGVGPS